MSRRERTTTIQCAQDGCRESACYVYGSQREYAEIHQAQRRDPYRCTRHRNPDEVLRLDNLTTTAVLVATRIGDLPGLYW